MIKKKFIANHWKQNFRLIFNFLSFFTFLFITNTQVISHSTNNPDVTKILPMACPTIGEQKGSSLRCVYLYQVKKYRVQNLELVKILFLEKYDYFKNDTFTKKSAESFIPNQKILTLWAYGSIQVIRLASINFKKFYYIFSSKNQNLKKRKLTMEELFLSKKNALFAMPVRRTKFVSENLLDKKINFDT